MKSYRLEEFVKGWIVGNFKPSLFINETMEVGVKNFQAGEREASHKQLIATEITIVTAGEILIGGIAFSKGDIALIPPGEFADFLSITDSTLVVLKFPSIPNDKILE